MLLRALASAAVGALESTRVTTYSGPISSSTGALPVVAARESVRALSAQGVFSAV